MGCISTSHSVRHLSLSLLFSHLTDQHYLNTVKTHRELFADFFASLFGYPLEKLIAMQEGRTPPAASKMWKVGISPSFPLELHQLLFSYLIDLISPPLLS